MKRLFLLALFGLSIASCDYGAGDEVIVYHLQSYVLRYSDGPLSLTSMSDYETERMAIGLNLEPDNGNWENEMYVAPEMGGEGENAEKFLEIAERNGDRSYDRDEGSIQCFPERICHADHFREIRVVCLNGDWDLAHPRGTQLGNIITARIYSYADYVRNGYTGDPTKKITKKVSELTEADLTLFNINDYPTLIFDTFPTVAGSYEIKVTMVATDNIEKVATCTFVVE